MTSDWKTKRVEPEWVIKRLKPGMRIFLSSGASEPRTMIRAILSSPASNLEDTEFVQLVSLGETVSSDTLCSSRFRFKTFFSGWTDAAAVACGQANMIPSRFVRIPFLFESGLISIDVAIIQITPPNDAGFCSLGTAVDVAREAMENANLTIGEINPRAPITYGDTFIPVSEFDHLIEAEAPLLTIEPEPVDEVINKVAFNVAALIENGSCIAFSIGPLFDALGNNLAGKKNLGIHSPFFTDALKDLMVCGAVNNRRKETYRGKALASYAIGSPDLLTWLDCNPLVEFQRVDKVFNPANIGRNPKFVTVIPARRIDLFGRVSLQTGRENLITSPSEVMDFFNGAELSQGGKEIFALPSRDSQGRANIVVSVVEDPNQFSLYESVRMVVTEYGVAYLEGRTVRERAQMLIDIAHPDDRSRLVEQAKAERILYADQIFLSESARLYPVEVNETESLKGGLTVSFRAIRPSDEEGMRRLFYRFSIDSIYSRYFHSITSMPHAKMQEYVNVDWKQVMSIVGLVEEKGERRLIAEGRYIRIPGTEKAEVVFVVDETYQSAGIATYLYLLLVRLARERGVRVFVADVLFSNSAMMKVFRKGNLPIRAYLEGGVYHLEISLF